MICPYMVTFFLERILGRHDDQSSRGHSVSTISINADVVGTAEWHAGVTEGLAKNYRFEVCQPCSNLH